MINYSKHQCLIIKTYKIPTKVKFANSRFEDKITIFDIVCLLERSNYKCLYCADTLKSKTWQLDHFYARACGGKNVISNLAASCKWCNLSKSAMDGYAYVEKCKKVAEKNLLIKNENVY